MKKLDSSSWSLRWRNFAVGFLFAALAQGAAPASAGAWPTEGGEPGRIIEVTTLADSGVGSLRAAVESGGRRKIVFKVAGEIWLQGTLAINNPFVTVAGETAPSPGITLMADRVRIRTHDVVLRHLRVRVGALPTGTPPENRDGIAIAGAEDGSDPAYNVLVENCSVSWSIDELVSITGKNSHDIVVRRSILAEALRNSIHPSGPHSMGLMVGEETRNILIQGNLLAHNNVRNPVIHGGSEAMVVNNLIYDPGSAGVHFYPNEGSAPTRAAIVNNYVIGGPSSPKTKRLHAFGLGLNEGSEINYSNNIADAVWAFDTSERVPGTNANPFVPNPPTWLNVVDILPSADVPAYVLAEAGARPWDRDAVDMRIISEVRTRTGQIRDAPTDPRLAAPP